MKKYIIILTSLVLSLFSVNGFANSTSSLEATLKMFKFEYQSLVREFLTVKEKTTEPILIKLINNELNAEVLFEEEYKGDKFVSIKENVTKEQVDRIKILAQSIADVAFKEKKNMKAAVFSSSLVDTANVKALDFKLKAK